MGKGSNRRPAAVGEREVAENWRRTFGGPYRCPECDGIALELDRDVGGRLVYRCGCGYVWERWVDVEPHGWRGDAGAD